MESNLKDLWNIVERPPIQIIGVSVGRERENGTGEIIGGKNDWEFSKTNKWHRAAESRSPKTPSRVCIKKLHLGTTQCDFWK